MVQAAIEFLFGLFAGFFILIVWGSIVGSYGSHTCHYSAQALNLMNADQLAESSARE